MTSSAVRIAHYNNRMVSSLIDPTVASMVNLATANYTIFAMDFTNMQMSTGDVLDSDGIGPADRAKYQAYAGQLWHASKVLKGAALTAEAQILHDKFETLGLATATLVSIALNVFSIVVV